MSTYPIPAFWRTIISTTSYEMQGAILPFLNEPFPSGVLWTTAKLVNYQPITIHEPMEISALGVWNGSVVAGNHDLGLYNGKTLAKIISTGTIARTGNANLLQVTTITATTLQAGFYFFAVTLDAGTDRVLSNVASLGYNGHGMRQETTGSFGLPATMTPVAATSASFICQVAMKRTGFPA